MVFSISICALERYDSLCCLLRLGDWMWRRWYHCCIMGIWWRYNNCRDGRRGMNMVDGPSRYQDEGFPNSKLVENRARWFRPLEHFVAVVCRERRWLVIEIMCEPLDLFCEETERLIWGLFPCEVLVDPDIVMAVVAKRRLDAPFAQHA